MSAVDTRVGKHIFEQAIQGHLKNKGVVLVTHQLQFVHQAHRIILIDNGGIAAVIFLFFLFFSLLQKKK